jgi:hypothetical protein
VREVIVIIFSTLLMVFLAIHVSLGEDYLYETLYASFDRPVEEWRVTLGGPACEKYTRTSLKHSKSWVEACFLPGTLLLTKATSHDTFP